MNHEHDYREFDTFRVCEGCGHIPRDPPRKPSERIRERALEMFNETKREDVAKLPVDQVPMAALMFKVEAILDYLDSQA